MDSLWAAVKNVWEVVPLNTFLKTRRKYEKAV